MIRNTAKSAGWARARAHIERVVGIALAALLLGMMFVTFADVVGRYFFNAPVPAAFEVTQLIMGILAYLGMVLATMRNENITVRLLTKHYKGAIGVLQTAVVWVLSFLLLSLFSWRLWIEADVLSQMNQRMMFLGVQVAPFVRIMSLLAALATVLFLMDAVSKVRNRSGGQGRTASPHG